MIASFPSPRKPVSFPRFPAGKVALGLADLVSHSFPFPFPSKALSFLVSSHRAETRNERHTWN